MKNSLFFLSAILLWSLAGGQTGKGLSVGVNLLSFREAGQVIGTYPVGSWLNPVFCSGLTAKLSCGRAGIRASYNNHHGAYPAQPSRGADFTTSPVTYQTHDARLGMYGSWPRGRFSFYTGADVYAAWRHFQYSISGGINPGTTFYNRRQYAKGVSPFGGVAWTPVPRLTLAIETALYYERITETEDGSQVKIPMNFQFGLNPINSLTLFINLNRKKEK